MAKAPDTSGHMRRAQVELRWDHLQSDSVTVGEFRAGSAGLCRHSLAEGVRPTVLSLSRHPDGKTGQSLHSKLSAGRLFHLGFHVLNQQSAC